MQSILIKAKDIKKYSEIFQSISLCFSFVKQEENTFTQLFTPVKCRDFLGDVVWANEVKKPVQIYGFTYDYKLQQIDKDALKLSITFPNPETLDNFVINFNQLTTKENSAKCKESTLLSTDDPLTLIIIADKIWQSSQWKISLFTYYLKCISYQDKSKLQEPENKYAELLTPEIEKQFLNKLFEMETIIKTELYDTHNCSGFVSIIKNHNKEMNQLLLGE